MEVLKYLNSRDVRMYLEGVGYSFAPLDAAKVIDACEHIKIDTVITKQSRIIVIISKLPEKQIPLHGRIKTTTVKGDLYYCLLLAELINSAHY